MRWLLLSLLIALAAGCASSPGVNYAGGSISPNGVPIDPTYPGPGARFGFGVGSWGSGVGIGVGF